LAKEKKGLRISHHQAAFIFTMVSKSKRENKQKDRER
jgi:hypothetical protein